MFFDRDYRSLIDLTSYGHDIETSWLLDWGCSVLGDRATAERIGKMTGRLAEHVYENGFRGRSVVNECENGKVDVTRIWWVQAEAVLGFLNRWKKSGEEKYLSAARKVFEHIKAAQVDRRCGEWFWAVDEKDRPDMTRPMAGAWKCPYHNGRMCLEIIRRYPDV